MNPSIHSRRWVTGLVLAAIVTTCVAPAANADWRVRYKYSRPAYGPRVYHSPGSVYVIRRSGPGPVIAGFLGGLFLGATLAHAAPAGYEYYDPYCGERFTSLDAYQSHLYRHHHPRVVRVIEVRSGDCVRSYRYQDGNWRGYDDQDNRDYRDDRYNQDNRYNRDDRYNQDNRYNRDDRYNQDNRYNKDDRDNDDDRYNSDDPDDEDQNR